MSDITSILEAILLATFACGVLDATAALTQAATLGMKPQRVWQGVASGLLGPRSFENGWRSGSLGLVLHFLIACIISIIYVLASQRLPLLLRHPLIVGALYGIAVYTVMNYVVLPLSRRPQRPFHLKFALTQLFIHIFVVGWSIALSAHLVLQR